MSIGNFRAGAFWITGLFAATLVGCASTGGDSKKEQNAVDTVQSAKESVEKTNQYIQRAENTLKNFEQELAGLRKDAKSSPELRGKDRFLLSLGAFDGRIAESRYELQQLKLANSESWDAYQRRVKAAEGVLKEEFRSRVSEAPKAPSKTSQE